LKDIVVNVESLRGPSAPSPVIVTAAKGDIYGMSGPDAVQVARSRLGEKLAEAEAARALTEAARAHAQEVITQSLEHT
jgi:hypothetical protein